MTTKEARDARLAAQLRENLRRRKVAGRVEDAPAPDPGANVLPADR
jgi:hypothetical protein